MSIIETERLVLTPASVADYDDLCARWANPDFVRHISGQPMNAETVWLRLLRDIGHWQVFDYGNWTISRRDTGARIGSVGVFDYRRDIEPRLDALEVGWGLDPAHQGMGFAAEALAAVLTYADQTLKAPRTLCMIGPENEPSLKLALKCGFTPLRQSVFHDHPVFVLERMAAV